MAGYRIEVFNKMKNKTTLSLNYEELELLYLSLIAHETLLKVCPSYSKSIDIAVIPKLKRRIAKAQVRVFMAAGK